MKILGLQKKNKDQRPKKMKSANVNKQLSLTKEKEVRLMEVSETKKKAAIRRTSTLAGKIVENKLKSLVEAKEK